MKWDGEQEKSFFLYKNTVNVFCSVYKRVPIQFFFPSRRLRKGCPLSPFLFLLVAEALSRLIHNAKEIRKIQGINVSNLEEVTRTLFVDDVLGFGKGTIMEKYLPIQRRQISNFQRSLTK